MTRPGRPPLSPTGERRIKTAWTIAPTAIQAVALAALGAATSALAIRGIADELVSRQAARARLEAMKTAILHME